MREKLYLCYNVCAYYWHYSQCLITINFFCSDYLEMPTSTGKALVIPTVRASFHDL